MTQLQADSKTDIFQDQWDAVWQARDDMSGLTELRMDVCAYNPSSWHKWKHNKALRDDGLSTVRPLIERLMVVVMKFLIVSGHRMGIMLSTRNPTRLEHGQTRASTVSLLTKIDSMRVRNS